MRSLHRNIPYNISVRSVSLYGGFSWFTIFLRVAIFWSLISDFFRIRKIGLDIYCQIINSYPAADRGEWERSVFS